MNAAWRYVSEWQQAVGVGTVHYRANNNPQKFADQPTKKVKFTPIYFCTSISIGWEANHWQPYMMKFAYWLHNFEEYIEYDTSLENPAVHIPIVKCIVRSSKIICYISPHATNYSRNVMRRNGSMCIQFPNVRISITAPSMVPSFPSGVYN